MKKHLMIGLLAVALIALGITSVPAADYSIKIGGGPTGGTFNTFTNAMAVYVPKVNPNIQASSVGSGGSVENLKRIHNGESDFGLCYAVDSALGYVGKLPQDPVKYNKIRSMGYLYGAPAQLVVRADSGVKSAMDLKGKRVALGNAGSGAAASAERFFRHIGLWDKFNPDFLGYSQAASAFQDGKIDAFWVLVGYPNRSIIEAAVQVKIALVDVGVDAEKTGFYKEYRLLADDHSGRHLRQGHAGDQELSGFLHIDHQHGPTRGPGLHDHEDPVVQERHGGHGNGQEIVQGNDPGKRLHRRLGAPASRAR